jgi:glutathione S-transferase
LRLFVTRPSPYARKAWAAVHELGLIDRVEVVELPARMPQTPKPDLDAINPLGKVPALCMGDGRFIVDSPVILAYLDALAGEKLLPAGEDRWRVLTLEALADGCMDAGVVLRIEQLKGGASHDPLECAVHEEKIARTLDEIERSPHWLAGAFNRGQLALACAVDWLVFRDLVPDPLAGRPRLAALMRDLRARPALAATALAP